MRKYSKRDKKKPCPERRGDAVAAAAVVDEELAWLAPSEIVASERKRPSSLERKLRMSETKVEVLKAAVKEFDDTEDPERNDSC